MWLANSMLGTTILYMSINNVRFTHGGDQHTFQEDGTDQTRPNAWWWGCLNELSWFFANCVVTNFNEIGGEVAKVENTLTNVFIFLNKQRASEEAQCRIATAQMTERRMPLSPNFGTTWSLIPLFGHSLVSYSKVLGSNLGRDVGYPQDFRDFRPNTKTIPRLGHDHFLPNPFAFVFHHLPSIILLFTVQILKNVVKLPTENRCGVGYMAVGPFVPLSLLSHTHARTQPEELPSDLTKDIFLKVSKYIRHGFVATLN
jgi:hypothetical protein